MTAHIVAMGGGGFSMSPLGAPTNIDRYLIELTGKASPLVCFAPTASADDPQYINRFLTAYGTLGVRTHVLTLWEGAMDSVKRIEECDVFFAGAGQTVNMMALWKAHGVTKALKKRYAAGDVVFAGLGAGANGMFQGSVTDSFGPFLPWKGGLGLLSGSFCPHFDGEGDRAPVYTDAVANGDLPGGYGVDDGAALHFVDGQLHRAIAERARARVYRVEPSDLPTSSGVLSDPLAVEVI